MLDSNVHHVRSAAGGTMKDLVVPFLLAITTTELKQCLEQAKPMLLAMEMMAWLEKGVTKFWL